MMRKSMTSMSPLLRLSNFMSNERHFMLPRDLQTHLHGFEYISNGVWSVELSPPCHTSTLASPLVSSLAHKDLDNHHHRQLPFTFFSSYFYYILIYVFQLLFSYFIFIFLLWLCFMSYEASCNLLYSSKKKLTLNMSFIKDHVLQISSCNTGSVC